MLFHSQPFNTTAEYYSMSPLLFTKILNNTVAEKKDSKYIGTVPVVIIMSGRSWKMIKQCCGAAQTRTFWSRSQWSRNYLKSGAGADIIFFTVGIKYLLQSDWTLKDASMKKN